MLKEFNEENFESEVLKNELPVVVDFWAEWCGPCKMLTPIITDLANDYDGKVSIGKVNIDTCPNIAAQYGVSSIPTLLFFKGGKIVEQHAGLLAKKPLQAKIDGAFA